MKNLVQQNISTLYSANILYKANFEVKIAKFWSIAFTNAIIIWKSHLYLGRSKMKWLSEGVCLLAAKKTDGVVHKSSVTHTGINDIVNSVFGYMAYFYYILPLWWYVELLYSEYSCNISEYRLLRLVAMVTWWQLAIWLWDALFNVSSTEWSVTVLKVWEKICSLNFYFIFVTTFFATIETYAKVTWKTREKTVQQYTIYSN